VNAGITHYRHDANEGAVRRDFLPNGCSDAHSSDNRNRIPDSSNAPAAYSRPEGRWRFGQP
jgi:hypothetical protein